MYKKVFCPKQKHQMYTEQKSMVEIRKKKVLIRKWDPNVSNGRSISTCTKKCTSLRIILEGRASKNSLKSSYFMDGA